MEGLIAYMKKNGGDATATQERLRLLLERYPYFHAARLLMLRSLYIARDENFGQELRKAALYVPSRAILYDLIEGDNMKPQYVGKKKNDAKHSESLDRTGSLIDDFLQTLPEESASTRRNHPVNAAVDYIGYLEQQEGGWEAEGESNIPLLKGDDRLTEFLREDEGKLTLTDRPANEIMKPLLDESNDEDLGALTETMAQIYIKQGKFEKALEIIRQLYLKYPKKNSYFADQIRFLEKVVINNKNK